MRRREPPKVTSRALPPEFAIGRCIEVWSADGPKPWSETSWEVASTQSRYSSALSEYAATNGLTWYDAVKLRPGGSPYSVDYLVTQGRRPEAVRHLAAGGATMSDVPALRQVAKGWCKKADARGKGPRRRFLERSTPR